MRLFGLTIVLMTLSMSCQGEDLGVGAEESGGIVERTDAVPSRQILVLNRQKLLDLQSLTNVVANARVLSCLPFRLKAENAPVTVELTEMASGGALVIFPEDNRAVVNMTALNSDSPKLETLKERTEKEIIRAALYVLGSGYSHNLCISRHLTTLKELDAVQLQPPSPEALMHVRAMHKCGIKLVRLATYRQACQEGWAKPPVTAEQKVVFEEEIKRRPATPIKIEFDPKKGR